MGWTVPEVRRKLNMFRLWARLEKMDDHRWTKRVYRWDHTCRTNNCSKDNKHKLEDIDKAELWKNGGFQISLKEFIGYAEEKTNVYVQSKME